MSNKEKLKCHKIPNVLQYYEPNRHVPAENYYHHMFLCIIHSELKKRWKVELPPTYLQMSNQPDANRVSC